ncbi:hypothetical protein H310_01460 [Aphanomyces invadans]|uniref:Uncharacterized protein n=1 Tax=Aphanomyces invadans TaxID=157072 RepID=A0A024USU5_9STRA|nr:hypothetical protein H310_01460 [Aphanomyces invadans]ETW08982.1 hypothetical protein H310_01460 [Aphanomyces invadans]|eukprot:XP_008862787.1 hypothetical protein H310_01460 [Aphanomyces invadans]
MGVSVGGARSKKPNWSDLECVRNHRKGEKRSQVQVAQRGRRALACSLCRAIARWSGGWHVCLLYPNVSTVAVHASCSRERSVLRATPLANLDGQGDVLWTFTWVVAVQSTESYLPTRTDWKPTRFSGENLCIYRCPLGRETMRKSDCLAVLMM